MARFFSSSSSSFRFLAFGFLFMDSFISGWITLIWSLTTRGLELLIKNYGCPLISIRKMKKKKIWLARFFFFFFLSFSSFWFSSHFLDSIITGWNTLIQPQTPEGSYKTDGNYVYYCFVAHCSVVVFFLSTVSLEQDFLSIIDVLMFSQIWSMVICDPICTEILAFILVPS